MDRLLDLPDLTLRSTSVGRRVHDDRIVVIATTDLTLHKFHTVVHQPADRCVRKSGSGSVFLRPVDHSFGSVYVGNLCTGSSGSQSCTACVGKKVQHFDRTACITDLVTKPIPVDSLLWEKSGVFETERFQMESKIFVMEIPLLREVKEFPFTAAFFASVVVGVHVFPSTAYLRSVPDNLRIRTDQSIFTPAFQLFSTGSVNYFVFFPVICNPHIYDNLSFITFNRNIQDIPAYSV